MRRIIRSYTSSDNNRKNIKSNNSSSSNNTKNIRSNSYRTTITPTVVLLLLLTIGDLMENNGKPTSSCQTVHLMSWNATVPIVLTTLWKKFIGAWNCMSAKGR